MKVINVERQEHSIVIMTVQVEPDEFNAALRAAYAADRRKYPVHGFRPGRAPLKLVEKQYGRVFDEKAVEDTITKAATDAVKSQNLSPYAGPSLSGTTMLPEGGYTFTLQFPVYPEVTVTQYRGLHAKRYPVNVTEENVQASLDVYIRRATQLVSVDRPAEVGDTVLIDFEGTMDGVPFEGGKADQYSLELGSGRLIPGFEDQIRGMSPGEERDIQVTFPEHYQAEELAGKDAVFHIVLHEVKQQEVPEVDDEFAKDVSEFETLEELKADIRSKLEKEYGEKADNLVRNQLATEVSAHTEADPPEVMIQEVVDQLYSDAERQIYYYGMTMPEYLQATGTTEEQMRENLRPDALEQVMQRLAFLKIAELENIQASDEDVEAEYRKITEEHGLKDDDEQARLRRDLIREDLMIMRAVDLVVENAVLDDSEPPEAAGKEASPETEGGAAGPEEAAPEEPEESPLEAGEAPVQEEAAPEEESAPVEQEEGSGEETPAQA